jgi:PAS domain S-box-containing protein
MVQKRSQEKSPGDSYILVVEDSKVQAEVIAGLLEDNGYKVIKAANGRIALSAARNEIPALVVSDILMPEMDGFELTRQIRKDPGLAQIPIILLTGLTEASDVVQALVCGADSFVTKPYDDGLLLKKINQMLVKTKPVEKTREPSIPFPYIYDGQEYTIGASREKIIEFLLTTYELTMERNSALNRAQNELRDLNTWLEENVEERSKALRRSNTDLQESCKKLAAAEVELRGQYSALIEKESRIRESELFNRGLVENLPDYIIVYGPDGKVLYVNPATEMGLGYHADELVGTSVLSYFAEEHRDVLISMMKVRHEGHAVPAFETDIVAQDGCRRSVIAKGTLIQYHNSPAFLILLVDITERKDAEEALRQREEKFRGIFNKINDAIHLHTIGEDGTPGKFIDVNDIACQMLQYSRDEMLQYTPLDFTTEYHNRPIDKIMEELVTDGGVVFETGHKRKDGTIVPVEINAHVITLMGKKVVISVVRDITERKKTDEKIRNSLVQIESDLEQMALFNDQIRNPLSVIVALLDREGESKTNTRIREQAFKINTLVSTLDRQYAETEKVREFLRKHYDFIPGADV